MPYIVRMADITVSVSMPYIVRMADITVSVSMPYTVRMADITVSVSMPYTVGMADITVSLRIYIIRMADLYLGFQQCCVNLRYFVSAVMSTCRIGHDCSTPPASPKGLSNANWLLLLHVQRACPMLTGSSSCTSKGPV